MWMEEMWTFPGIWIQYDAPGSHHWYLSSVGPDGDYDQTWSGMPGANHMLYDPSNGTISDGDIIRVGP